MYVQSKYYKILESTKYDDIDTIKRNYKRIMFNNHPDRGGSEDFAKDLNIAWEIIKKYHIQQTRPSSNDKTESTSHKNTSSKTSNTNSSTNDKTNKTNYSKKQYGASSRSKKTKNKSKQKNKNHKCSNCGSQYENDVFCDQCGQRIHHKKYKSNNNEDIELLCIGVVLITIGLFLLSICWPIGIIYFYILYKYVSS